VQIKLNYPSEYLLQIKGSYDDFAGITSITFKSSLKAYGPYGRPGKYTFQSEWGRIVGFWGGFGTYGNNTQVCRFLDSIGVFTVIDYA